MAFCPKCRGTMTATEAICPHCGYDFPDPTATAPRKYEFAYSPLADLALIVSSIAAALGCLLTIVALLVSILKGELLPALIVCPIAFLLQMGMLVVFLRIQGLKQTS